MRRLLVSSLCLALMLIVVANTAMAASFTLNFVSAASPSNCTPANSDYGWSPRKGQNGKMFVYHDVSCSASYTNMFKILYNGSTYGSKWCTPGSNIPINSNVVKKDRTFGVWGRANTKYATEDNIYSFIASGTYGWPLK